MQKLFFILCCLSLSVVLKAQQSKELYNDSKLSIKANTTECSDLQNGIHQEKILLEFQNKTNQPITISFNRNLWYDDQPLKTEKISIVTLQPNQVIKGGCDTKEQAYYIFSKHLNLKGRVLTKYELANLTITTNER